MKARREQAAGRSSPLRSEELLPLNNESLRARPEAKSDAQQSPSPENSRGEAAALGPPELCNFVAKVATLGHLLQSRLAVPLLYPLNSRGMTDPLKASSMASQRWQRGDVILALGQVAPAALALSRVGSLLRLARACQRAPGGSTLRRRIPTDRCPESAGEKAPLDSLPNSCRETVHFLRPQVWRVLKPGEERATKHLKWR